MLKKLRRRFILAAMAAFGAVMLLLTAGINVLNYYQVAKSQDHTIEGIHEYTQFHVPAPDHALPPISQMPWANSEEADYTIRFFILTLNTDTVTALSWEYNEETLAFHKEESWLYDEDENFPVDPEKISSFLEQFQEFGVSFIIEDVEDYGQYGLDEPLCTIISPQRSRNMKSSLEITAIWIPSVTSPLETATVLRRRILYDCIRRGQHKHLLLR